MGLLDTALSALQNGAASNGGEALASSLSGLLNNAGGLNGLAQQFEQGGLGHVIASWMSGGQNLPISPEQLQQVLGSDTVAQIARQLGVDPSTAASHLSQILPAVVDRMTPNGQSAASSDHASLVPQALSGLLR